MGSKIKNAERRKFPRIDSKVKIRYKEFHKPLKVFRMVHCLNIGLGGCRFETFEKLPENLVLTIYINIPLPYSYQIVSAKIFAKVVQTKTTDDKKYCSSVYFLAVDRKGAIALKQWLDKESKITVKRTYRLRKRSEKHAAVV